MYLIIKDGLLTNLRVLHYHQSLYNMGAEPFLVKGNTTFCKTTRGLQTRRYTVTGNIHMYHRLHKCTICYIYIYHWLHIYVSQATYTHVPQATYIWSRNLENKINVNKINKFCNEIRLDIIRFTKVVYTFYLYMYM